MYFKTSSSFAIVEDQSEGGYLILKFNSEKKQRRRELFLKKEEEQSVVFTKHNLDEYITYFLIEYYCSMLVQCFILFLNEFSFHVE